MCDCNNKSNGKPVKGTVPTWSQNWLFLCKGLSVCLGEMTSGSAPGGESRSRFTGRRSQGPSSSPRNQPQSTEEDKGKKSPREIQPQSQGR